jgi:quercetin dioxygenase-like cupin family protein
MNGNPVKEIATLINSNGVRVVEFLLAPKTHGAWHHHSQLSETCYCLKGQLSVDIEGNKTLILLPGEKCKITVGIRHSVFNAVHTSCTFLVVQGIGDYDFVENE